MLFIPKLQDMLTMDSSFDCCEINFKKCACAENLNFDLRENVTVLKIYSKTDLISTHFLAQAVFVKCFPEPFDLSSYVDSFLRYKGSPSHIFT